MTLATFYLICFVVGFSLSAVMFLAGVLHLPMGHHLHLPEALGHHGGAGVHGIGAHGGGGHAGAAGAHAAHGHTSTRMSWINPASVLMFLTWFGGTGYLATTYYRLWFLLGLGLATVSGLVGAAIVSWFLVRVLLGSEKAMEDADYQMAGLLGTVNVAIREAGTGEIIFSQEGVRRCAGARSENGAAIPKGAEVVIARYEKGIAYVSLWEEWSK